MGLFSLSVMEMRMVHSWGHGWTNVWSHCYNCIQIMIKSNLLLLLKMYYRGYYSPVTSTWHMVSRVMFSLITLYIVYIGWRSNLQKRILNPSSCPKITAVLGQCAIAQSPDFNVAQKSSGGKHRRTDRRQSQTYWCGEMKGAGRLDYI